MPDIRTDWTRDEIAALFDLPFTELLFRAASVHRENHAPDQVQLCTLLSIKTGGCPEDCGYCSQSVHADSGVKATKLMDVRQVLQSAAQAKDNGSQRFCMGAAWRNPKDRDMPAIVEIVKGVAAMGMETCMTLGMLTPKQADMLAEAGLDYYNHNIDSSPEYYERVISTRGFDERIETLDHVRGAGINVCSGGIVGMGETREDRVGFVHTLATLPQHPESVPVNALVPVKGTVLGDMLADTPLAKIDDIEFVRTVAVARITHAAEHGAAERGPREHERGDAGAVLHGGCEQHLHRRQAADRAQCGRRQRRRAVREAGSDAAEGRGADAGDSGGRVFDGESANRMLVADAQA